MRIPLRFTVRRLLISTAVAGLLLFAAIRVVPALWKFCSHAAAVRRYDGILEYAFFEYESDKDMTPRDWWLVRIRDYHAERKALYLRSLLRFWEPLPVESIPPPPPASRGASPVSRPTSA